MATARVLEKAFMYVTGFWGIPVIHRAIVISKADRSKHHEEMARRFIGRAANVDGPPSLAMPSLPIIVQ